MKVICVDDEPILLENFKRTAEKIPLIKELHTFSRGHDAIDYVMEHPIDVAFLDIQMPGISGMELAKKLKEVNENIQIVFVTAFDEHALNAFRVGAIGYLLKPYTEEDVKNELNKASLVRKRPKKRIEITTMPDFSMKIDGKPVQLGHTKQEELFAFLVDHGEIGTTKNEIMDALWEEREMSDSAYWVTMSRLVKQLTELGIEDVIATTGKTKHIHTEMIDCDLYRMLDGEDEIIEKYSGQYLRRYSWAEVQNAKLSEIYDTHW